jgi:hypothetical protein
MSKGVEKIVPIVAGAAVGYLTMNPAVGMATYGALNGVMSDSSGASGSAGGTGGDLGKQQVAPVVSANSDQVATSPASSPFDVYGAMGGSPSGGMSLSSASSQVPSGADKGMGQANSALRMYGDMTAANEQKKQNDAAIAAAEAKSAALLHPVVPAQMPGYVGLNIGNAQTIPGGFRFY